MLELSNGDLTVTLLDPRSDQRWLGARYCTGGYIFQVSDQAHGDLLSTPARPFSKCYYIFTQCSHLEPTMNRKDTV